MYVLCWGLPSTGQPSTGDLVFCETPACTEELVKYLFCTLLLDTYIYYAIKISLNAIARHGVYFIIAVMVIINNKHA